MEILKKVHELVPFVEGNSSLKNLLFDLDGTLIHSEPLHIQAVVYTLCEYDQTVSLSQLMKLQEGGINQELTGVNDYRVYEILQEKLGIKFSHSIEELMEAKAEFLRSDEVNALIKSPQCFLPELREALNALKDRGLKMGIVSASQKDFVHHVIKVLGLEGVFDFSVAREDCRETKPDPAPYLFALKEHALKSEESLIFEDSETGLKAAKASGIPFIQVSWYS